MSKSNALETSLLALLFNGTGIADLADNDATSPATTLTVSLHTADPGEAGTMTTSETAYTNYARQTVARTSGGFTVASGAVTLVANLDFPECGVTPGAPITHFGIGTGVSNNLMYSGTVSPNIVMATGVIPRLKNTAAIVTED
jgi:hypothetical protein